MANTREQLRYHTGEAHFAKDYEKKAFLQKSVNTQVIDYLSDAIRTWFPNHQELTILDLCCGDGGSTKQFLTSLQEKNIKVKQLLGYDISPAQIETARKHLSSNSPLAFQVLNVEDITETAQYDLIISFFGLHWLERLPAVVSKLHQALAPDGRIAFLVPLEKEPLFQLRQQCMSSPTWAPHFKNYTLHPFLYHAADYAGPFTEYFIPDTNNYSWEILKKHTTESFGQFLGSWLQEERFLRLKSTDKKKPSNTLKI
jgi:SAM-dependent methyltransferase